MMIRRRYSVPADFNWPLGRRIRAGKYHFYPDDHASFNPPDAQGSDPVVSDRRRAGLFLRLAAEHANVGTLGTLNDRETYTVLWSTGQCHGAGT